MVRPLRRRIECVFRSAIDPDQSGEWSKSAAILPPTRAAFNPIADGLSRWCPLSFDHEQRDYLGPTRCAVVGAFIF